MCLLKPWRTEDDIKGSSQSYEQEFFRILQLNSLPKMKERYERKVSMKKLREEMEEKANAQVPEDPGQSSPNSQDGEVDDDAISDALRDFEARNKNSSIKTAEQLETFVNTLNADQKPVYDKITSRLSHIMDHKLGLCKDCPQDCPENKPILAYVSGFGGTGKSYLIKAIVGFMYVQKHVLNRPIDSVLGAPTGLAADNIKGQTLHSIFNIPVEHDRKRPHYQSLNKAKLDEVRAVMKNLQCVIIDEVSMVSNIMLLMIHLRMGDIFTPQGLFGNKSVILFGDLLQLPPVHSDPPFVEISGNLMHEVTKGSKIALNIWRNFEFFELTINQRQVGDKNALWKDMLSRIRIGTHTPEDISILSERCIPVSKAANTPDEVLDDIVEYFLNLDSSPVCFMPTCEMADRFNQAIMNREHPDFIQIPAKDEIDCKCKSQVKHAQKALEKLDKLDDPRNTAGLEKSLPLSNGARIMLRQNLDVNQGLFNGAMGEVLSMTPHSDSSIEKLLIQFDKSNEPTNLEKVKRKVKLFEGAFLHREQFPICLCYAMTIHKSQCLTLSSVMVDLGKKIFAESQAYVALSRVTSLEGLHLINFDPKKIIVNKAALREYARLGSKCVPSVQRSSKKSDPKTTNVLSERVWYISNARKKATALLDMVINDSKGTFKPQKPASKPTGRPRGRPPGTGKSKTSKKPAAKIPAHSKGKNKVPKGKDVIDLTNYTIPVVDSGQFIPIQCDVDDSLNRIMDSLLSCHTSTVERILSLYSMDEACMRNLFQTLIAVYGLRLSDDIKNKLAIELHPDPFGLGTARQKWLSTEVMDYYGWYLRDIATRRGKSVYYLSSLSRFLFLRHRGTEDLYLQDYLVNTHTAVQYSMDKDSDALEDGHTVYKGFERAGDPLSKDIIYTFGNDSELGHWYCIVLDKTQSNLQPSVTLFDSGSGCLTVRQVKQRCSFIIKFINSLSLYGQISLGQPWTMPQLQINDFQFINGRSAKQKNGFDCGVFSLLNAESYLMGHDHHIFEQNSIPYMRLHIMKNIKEFIMFSGAPVNFY